MRTQRNGALVASVVLLGTLTASVAHADSSHEDMLAGMDERSVSVEIEREVHQGDSPQGQPPSSEGGQESPSSGEQQAGYVGGGDGQSDSQGEIYAPSPGANYCVEGDGLLDIVCVGVMDHLCGAFTAIWDPDCSPDPADPQQPVESEPVSEEQAEAEQEPLPVITEQDFAELPIDGVTVGFEPELQGFGYLNRHTNVFADAETQVLTQEMLGYEVDIRAIPAEYHFDYGDGTTRSSFDAGGPLPDYDSAGHQVNKTDTETATSHIYTTTGQHPVTISTVYIGEYRIDGGEWQAIPGSTTIDSSPGHADIWRISSRNVGGECESSEAWGCNGPVELEPGEEPPAVFEDQYDHNGNWTG